MTWEDSGGEDWKPEDHPDRIEDELIESIRDALEGFAEVIKNYQEMTPEEFREWDKQQWEESGDLGYVLEGEIFRKAETYEELTSTCCQKLAFHGFSEGTFVSTVFLGIDHSFGGETPILFETWCCYKNEEVDMRRYQTYEAALTGHNELLAELEIAVKNDM